MERHKEFSRRAILLGGGKLFVFSVLASRLMYLQVVEQKKFKTLSDKNRISIRVLPSARGEIMDRFGVPMAINKPDFRAFIIPEQSQDIEETLDKLGRLIPISEEEKKSALKSIDRKSVV